MLLLNLNFVSFIETKRNQPLCLTFCDSVKNVKVKEKTVKD